MRRADRRSHEQSGQRQFITAENMMYDGIDNDGAQQSYSGQAHLFGTDVDADYDARTVFEFGSSTDSTPMEYDYAMEDLLQQLPSRQLVDIAEIASQALLKKHLGTSSTRQGTLRLRKSKHLEDQILKTLEHDLEDDDRLYSDLDEAVRTIPTTLSRKRRIKRRLSRRKSGYISRYQIFKYMCAMQWRQTRYTAAKDSRLFDLWRSHLKTIEGCFGTGVVSYFIFLKWVLLINIPIFLLTFSFLVIPQILYRHYQKNSTGAVSDREDFTGIEILTGTGFFEDSEMYYGFYTSETVKVISGSTYEMKYAYLLTCAGYYLFCLLILGYSFLRSYRKYYIEASGSLRHYYFSLVFCGWDYGITSEETGQLKHRSIYNEFKEYLAGVKTVQESPTRKMLFKKWCIRIHIWAVVLALLGASGFATYKVSIELSLKPTLTNSTTSVASSLTMPFVISSIQLVVPMVFSFMEAYEQFSKPKYELYIHMLREQLLRATMLGVLVYFWLKLASTQIACWETFVGQEIYRLTVMDMVFGILYTFFMEFIRKLCSLKWESINRAEFAIARHTLELIYTQSLCWLGIFYSPLLPVVVIVKLIITFYVKRYSVMHNCRPTLKPWRAYRIHTHFVGYTFLFFIFTCIAASFSIFETQPSKVCGPYQNYTTSYEVIQQLLSSWEKKYVVLGQIISIIDSPGFISAVLILLCVALYYLRTIMLSRKKRVEQFKLQLLLEAKDKKFLLNLLNQVRVKGAKEISRPGPSIVNAMNSRTYQEGQVQKMFIRTVAELIQAKHRLSIAGHFARMSSAFEVKSEMLEDLNLPTN